MGQIGEVEFRDAIIATKKDAKLVAAAKNERTNSPAGLYREFTKLTVDRQREIIVAIASDQFVAAQWKIAFPLNNFPAAVMPDAVAVAGKALFFSRDEDSVREAIRAVKIYQESPFFRQICAALADMAEIDGENLAKAAEILTSPEVYGTIRTLEAGPASEKIANTICRIAGYTRDHNSILSVARFLFTRRYSPVIASLCAIVENSIYLARDPRSVRQILTGLNAGGIDAVLLNSNGNQKLETVIQDVAWKTRDSKAIQAYLESMQRQTVAQS
jgi:hypothetical protein